MGTMVLGPYGYAGQYQQRPTPLGGIIIQRNWFQFWNAATIPPKFDEIVLSVDMNFGDTKSKEPSYVVGQVWGRKGVIKYLLDEIRDRWSFSGSLPHIRALIYKYPQMGFKLVEKKANGAAVISALETEFSGFVGIEPEGSKEARMYAASPDYASHCVFVPDPSMPGYEWSLEHIEEACHFPQEPNDRGDAASQAINYFRAHADGFGDWLKASKEKSDAEKIAAFGRPAQQLRTACTRSGGFRGCQAPSRVVGLPYWGYATFCQRLFLPCSQESALPLGSCWESRDRKPSLARWTWHCGFAMVHV